MRALLMSARRFIRNNRTAPGVKRLPKPGISDLGRRLETSANPAITAGGKLHAPVPQRVFWASMEGLVAAILLFGGGGEVLGALQAGAIATALPFSIVLLMCCVSLYKGLSHEWQRDSRLRTPGQS